MVNVNKLSGIIASKKYVNKGDKPNHHFRYDTKYPNDNTILPLLKNVDDFFVFIQNLILTIENRLTFKTQPQNENTTDLIMRNALAHRFWLR